MDLARRRERVPEADGSRKAGPSNGSRAAQVDPDTGRDAQRTGEEGVLEMEPEPCRGRRPLSASRVRTRPRGPRRRPSGARSIPGTLSRPDSAAREISTPPRSRCRAVNESLGARAAVHRVRVRSVTREGRTNISPVARSRRDCHLPRRARVELSPGDYRAGTGSRPRRDRLRHLERLPRRHRRYRLGERTGAVRRAVDELRDTEKRPALSAQLPRRAEKAHLLLGVEPRKPRAEVESLDGSVEAPASHLEPGTGEAQNLPRLDSQSDELVAEVLRLQCASRVPQGERAFVEDGGRSGQ